MDPGKFFWVRMNKSAPMAGSINIRQFLFPQDYSAVIDLWESSGPGIHVQKSDSPEEIQKKLLRDPDLFLLAEIDGQIIGTVIGGFDGRRGIIYHLAVEARYRKKGIGALLLHQVEERLAKKGCLKAYLLVTRENTSAIEFYRNQGWDSMDNLVIFGKELLP